ncbi:unnamed protein product, partial [marine sediment metagenome]
MHGHIYVTDIIDIKKLERENRKFLYTGLIISLFVCFDVWWLFV